MKVESIVSQRPKSAVGRREPRDSRVLRAPQPQTCSETSQKTKAANRRLSRLCAAKPIIRQAEAMLPSDDGKR